MPVDKVDVMGKVDLCWSLAGLAAANTEPSSARTRHQQVASSVAAEHSVSTSQLGSRRQVLQFGLTGCSGAMTDRQ